MYQTFRPFRLQPPVAASRAWSGLARELTARSADRIPFEDHSVSWASPLPSRLATTTGRIEFVILRTSRSPPVALHPLSRGRSYFRLQNTDHISTGTFTRQFDTLTSALGQVPRTCHPTELSGTGYLTYKTTKLKLHRPFEGAGEHYAIRTANGHAPIRFALKCRFFAAEYANSL